MRVSGRQIREEVNQTGFDFLMTDLDTRLAFIQIARGPNFDAETKRRNVINARRAYDTVGRLRERLQLDSEQQRAFDEKRMSLKNALEQMGERI